MAPGRAAAGGARRVGELARLVARLLAPGGRRARAEPLREAAKALDALGLRRMVVGHTPQITAGINACCGGRVYRIDTGLSSTAA